MESQPKVILRLLKVFEGMVTRFQEVAMVLLCYGQCTWRVAARIKQLGLKFKGRNGEKIPNINTMGNAQDMVAIAAILDGDIGSIPRAGAMISFVGSQSWNLCFIWSCVFC